MKKLKQLDPPATKQAWVVEELRIAILSGEFEPGRRLLETDLAKHFNVSPTPIREAMRRLEAEGLLSSEPHRGVQVAEANIDETRELYLIRMALEDLAIRLAWERHEETPLEELEGLLDKMQVILIKEKLNQEEWRRLRALHWKFHYTLYQSANSQILLNMLGWIWVRLPWDRIESIPGRAQRVLNEHREIVLATGDQERAVKAVRNHLKNALIAFLTFSGDAHEWALKDPIVVGKDVINGVK